MKKRKLKPCDFDTETFHCAHLFYTKDEKPVAVLRSTNPDSPYWCVLYNYCDSYFTSYQQAIDFCENRGCTK